MSVSNYKIVSDSVTFSFANAADEGQIKQILYASGLEYRDISTSQLQHFLKAQEETHEAGYFAKNAKGGVLSGKSSGQQKGSG